jgi:hypothetical protein
MGGGKDYGIGTRSESFATLEVDDGNFDYEEQVMVETSQKNYRDFWIRPVGGVVNQRGPFTFVIEPMHSKYLQLTEAGLEMTCRVVKEDGTNLSMIEDIVAPVNLLGAVMWETVDVALNGRPFSGASAANAGMKAYVETMLSYDSDSRNTHLNSQMFHLDSPGQYGNMKVSNQVLIASAREMIRRKLDPGPTIPDFLQPETPLPIDHPQHVPLEGNPSDQMIDPDSLANPEEGIGVDITTLSETQKANRRKLIYDEYFKNLTMGIRTNIGVKPGGDVNKGYDNRYQIVCGSHPFDMYSPITHDFFKTNNHIGPGNKIEIRLDMYKYAFLLNSYFSWHGYKIQIDDMKLHLHTIERKERIVHSVLENYQMNETGVHRQLIAQHQPSANFRLLTGGIMPKTVIIWMTTSIAGDGNYMYNPFNLHHFHIKTMALIINGEMYPSGGLKFDFTKANCHVARAYKWMFENTGASNGEKGNIVSWPAFQAGCFIVPFDLTPDRCNGLHNHNAERGFLDIDISFSYPLPTPIYVWYEMVFPKVVVNDKLNNTVTVLDVEV